MLKIAYSPKNAETKLTFALPLDHPAGPVSVVGNFNDWTPGATRLVKRANGTMSASVTVPGNYIVNFRYLGDNGFWFDEPEADAVDAGASIVWARGEAAPAHKIDDAVAATKSVAKKAGAKLSAAKKAVTKKVEDAAEAAEGAVEEAVEAVKKRPAAKKASEKKPAAKKATSKADTAKKTPKA